MLTAFKAELAHEGPLVGVDHTTQAEVVVQPGIIVMQVKHLLCGLHHTFTVYNRWS